METIEVYFRGYVHHPARFWDYALRTNYKQSSGARMYVDIGFTFSEKYTEQYKALSDDEKKKVRFLYINGVKQA
jgi:hypothetical protein